jgi:hypothetical protein
MAGKPLQVFCLLEIAKQNCLLDIDLSNSVEYNHLTLLIADHSRSKFSIANFLRTRYSNSLNACYRYFSYSSLDKGG